MEEEAEKGGAHPAVAVDGTSDDGAHCGLQRRAAGVVERRRELAIGHGREKQEKGKANMQWPVVDEAMVAISSHTIVAQVL